MGRTVGGYGASWADGTDVNLGPAWRLHSVLCEMLLRIIASSSFTQRDTKYSSPLRELLGEMAPLHMRGSRGESPDPASSLIL